MPDLAVPAIGIVSDALGEWFAPASVHFFAGEGPATAAWNVPGACDEPFLWVRVARRYRTRGIPEVAIEQQPCKLPRAVAVEVGVGRCAVNELEPTWGEYDAEGVLSLEDSWRIESVLCTATNRLTAADYAVVTEEVLPVGPEGGVIAWTGMIHIQYQ